LIFVATSLADTLSEIKSRGELRVCHWPDYYGISYRNPRTGDLQGIDIDMSKELANDLGVKLVYVETNFARFMDVLESGKCDIAMMGVGVTPPRQTRIDFSNPYLRSDIYFITTKANKNLQTVADLDQPGVVIAVQKGTVMEPFSKAFFKKATLSIVSKPGEREFEVEAGRADAFATDYPYSQRMLQNTDWARLISPQSTLRTSDYAYAVRKGDKAWLDEVNAFVKRVKTDGRLERAAENNQLLPVLVRD
jgi:ABC-type amino acid transport substrate-binding protein